MGQPPRYLGDPEQREKVEKGLAAFFQHGNMAKAARDAGIGVHTLERTLDRLYGDPSENREAIIEAGESRMLTTAMDVANQGLERIREELPDMEHRHLISSVQTAVNVVASKRRWSKGAEDGGSSALGSIAKVLRAGGEVTLKVKGERPAIDVTPKPEEAA